MMSIKVSKIIAVVDSSKNCPIEQVRLFERSRGVMIPVKEGEEV